MTGVQTCALPIYDPGFNNGSSALSQNTSLRFSELKLKNLVSGAITDIKTWANNAGAAGNEVILIAPVNAGYEITFSQYDGCSNVCFQAQTPDGLKPLRLFWTKSVTYGTNGPTYITLTPQYFDAGKLICN